MAPMRIRLIITAAVAVASLVAVGPASAERSTRQTGPAPSFACTAAGLPAGCTYEQIAGGAASGGATPTVPTTVPAVPTAGPTAGPDTCDDAYPKPAVVGVATVVSARFKAPGADWAAIPPEVRICNYYRAQGGLTGLNHVTVSLQHAPDPANPRLQDVERWIPRGSRLEIVLDMPTSAGAPSQFIGALDDPDVAFSGQRVTVRGNVATVRWPEDGSSCTTAAPRGISMFDVVTGSTNPLVATALTAFTGSFIGTNAHTFNPPAPSTSGVQFKITGCGDGNPATPDGFAKGFVPLAALALMGIPAEAFSGVPAAAIDGFLSMVNNGATAPAATFTRTTMNGLDGIFFVYQTSFSPHTLAVRPDLRSLKVLQSCPAKQVKSKTVKKGKQKGKTTLSCAKKP